MRVPVPTAGLPLKCFAILLAALLLTLQNSLADELPRPKIKFYGHINQGILVYDDGAEHRTYGPVDNSNSSSRIGVFVSGQRDAWEGKFNLELQYDPYPSNKVNQITDALDWSFEASDVRHLEGAFSNEGFGRLWIGQGSMASDGSAEVDLSGTTIIAYASVPDTAGGNFFRKKGGALSSITVGDAFDDLDGLGKKVRIRFDTPNYRGLSFKASYGRDLLNSTPDRRDENLFDVAASYSQVDASYHVAAAIAFARNSDADKSIGSGSVSLRHQRSGLSLTVAGGHQAERGEHQQYGYGKIGYAFSCFDIGPTAVSLDYYLGSGFEMSGSHSNSLGIAAVQAIEPRKLKLWLLYRSYRYDDPADDYKTGQAIFGGVYIPF
jgi:hypothetical protein